MQELESVLKSISSSRQNHRTDNHQPDRRRVDFFSFFGPSQDGVNFSSSRRTGGAAPHDQQSQLGLDKKLSAS
jgi:hypothetical protein